MHAQKKIKEAIVQGQCFKNFTPVTQRQRTAPDLFSAFSFASLVTKFLNFDTDFDDVNFTCRTVVTRFKPSCNGLWRLEAFFSKTGKKRAIVQGGFHKNMNSRRGSSYSVFYCLR